MAQLVADATLRSSQERRWVDVPSINLEKDAKGVSFESLAGKVAVVTGGGTGIGKATALKLANAGARVFILGRRVEPLKEVEEEFRKTGISAVSGGRIHSVSCDVGDSASVEAAFKHIFSTISSPTSTASPAPSVSTASPPSAVTSTQPIVDILVNSAGINIPARQVSVLSAADYKKVMSANVDGAFFCIHQVLPGMRSKKNGVIVNISSVAALKGLPLAGAAYCASKAAMSALGNEISAEVFEDGVKVTNICPGKSSCEISFE
jgi:NAD(P)-dependent dehydrogenase (short-subunit alcohol dehydrogenase family)